jgi:hypothetical protein
MKFWIYTLSVLVVICSCSKPEENFTKIPSEFTAAIDEDINSNGEHLLWLELSSTNSQYCPDDSLVYQSSVINNIVTIELADSYKSNDCIQRNYFLKSRINIPQFTDSLQIDLQLGSSSLIHFTVFNFKNYYTIVINSGNGLREKYEKTYKIPQNILWGYAYPLSIGPTSDITIKNFKKDIENELNIVWLPKGYYTYFSVLDYNVLQLNENPGIAGSILNFYYSHNKSEDELKNYFNELTSKYVGLVGFKINSGSGQEYSSY